MITVEDLYREDVSDGIISVSSGKELRGPCPDCGGEDRFGVYTSKHDGEGDYFCGRGKGIGNGCGKGGDIIQYLIHFRQMDYIAACRYLGKEPKCGGGKHLRYALPQIRKQRKQQKFVPADLQYPEEVVDPALWRKKGMEFVEKSHQALLKRPTSIAYLMTRGISIASIKKFKLGFHAGEVRNGKEYQPSFRPWVSRGLRDEKRPGGNKPRMLILPAGIVIPFIVDGNLHRLTIRLIKIDPKYPNKKYHYVIGSIRDLWLTNPSARVFVTQEAELDCIAIDEAAGDLVGTIGIGGSGVQPDARTYASCKGSLRILGGLDYDKAGIKGGKFWRKEFPQYLRWPVPEGKDAGEAFLAGVDLRMWIELGLPDALSSKESTASNDVEKQEVNVPVVKEPETLPEVTNLTPLYVSVDPVAEGGDLKELKQLLEDAGGSIVINNQGYDVGVEISPSWSDKFPEKRRRITALLYNSYQVSTYVENLADGMYGADRIAA